MNMTIDPTIPSLHSLLRLASHNRYPYYPYPAIQLLLLNIKIWFIYYSRTLELHSILFHALCNDSGISVNNSRLACHPVVEK